MNWLLGRVQSVVPASEVPEELVDQVIAREEYVSLPPSLPPLPSSLPSSLPPSGHGCVTECI